MKKAILHLLNALLSSSDNMWSELCRSHIPVHFGELATSFLETGKSQSVSDVPVLKFLFY